MFKGFDVAIVTMDKDFFQLVRDGVRVFNPRDEGTWYDAAGVKEKFGVRPDQVVDVMALMGDTIDNIKGVPGIGEKGATELIGKYESLDNLIAHAVRAHAQAARDAARQRRGRASEPRAGAHPRQRAGRRSTPRRFRYRGATPERCFQIFNELGFRTIVNEYAPTAASVARTYRIVNTTDGVRALAARLQANGSFAFRVLPDRPSAMRASIVGLAFSTSAREADYVPTGHRALGDTASLAAREACSSC